MAPLRTGPLTKIVATIGPASRTLPMLRHLIEEGLRVVRINFSHGSFDDFADYLRLVRQASEEVGIPVAILGDLSGPKIRIPRVRGGELMLNVGDKVAFTEAGDEAHREADTDLVVIPTTYPALVHEVQPGHRVLVDDGNVRMLAVEQVAHAGGDRLICRVTQAGPISNRKGVNLPDTSLSMPSLTDYDHQCLDWAVREGLDYVALSFVRSGRDVEQLLEAIRQRQPAGTSRRDGHLAVIAKIETPQALNDLDAILRLVDGVMVARGDLGVEMELWQVPVIQKRIIRLAHDHGKPVIVATQMLQSMIEQGTPTRAEVSDVANAVLDGADALMLSGETAVGRHPTATVRVMARTAELAERYQLERDGGQPRPPRLPQESRYRTAALAHGVTVVVRDLEARYVVLWSELGGGARYLSQHRLAVPVIAISSNHAALRRMSLMFGVHPVWMARPTDSEAFLHAVDELMQRQGWAEPGDPIVVVMGEPLGTAGVTNELRIHYVGDVCRVRWHAKER